MARRLSRWPRLHSASVVEAAGVARRAAVACAGRLDRAAALIQLVDAHVAPASASLPLEGEVRLDADGAGGLFGLGLGGLLRLGVGFRRPIPDPKPNSKPNQTTRPFWSKRRLANTFQKFWRSKVP